MKKKITAVGQAMMASGVTYWIAVALLDVFPPSNAAAGAATRVFSFLLGVAVTALYFSALRAIGRKLEAKIEALIAKGKDR